MPSGSLHTHASEPSLPDLGARARRRETQSGATRRQTHSPGQTSTGQRDEHNTPCCFHRTRPETHQNLIHPDKEQNRRRMTINVGRGWSSIRPTTPRSRDLSAIQSDPPPEDVRGDPRSTLRGIIP
jgi:hypothetical protein